MEIPEVDDFQELTQKMWASFKLPQRISELHNVENYYLAPLAPTCLCWKDFLPQLDQKFPCEDIREEQLERIMSYAQDFQYWAEKSNAFCLLVGSILELREVMELYVSFFDDTVLSSVAPLEGFLEDQPETAIPGSDQPASTDPPIEEATMEEAAPIGGLWRNKELPRYHVRSG